MPFVNISLYLRCYYISKCILINNILYLEEEKIRQFLYAIVSQDSVLSIGLWMATELQQDWQFLRANVDFFDVGDDVFVVVFLIQVKV